MLHVMESKGYIDSYEETVNGRKCRCYTLTGKGRSVLADKKNQWEVLINAMERILRKELSEQSVLLPARLDRMLLDGHHLPGIAVLSCCSRLHL